MDPQRIVPFDGESEPRENVPAVLGRYGNACELAHEAGVEIDHALPVWCRAGDHHLGRFAAAPLQNEARGEFDSGQDESRIDTAFEAIARIGKDAELAACSCSPDRIEIGRLDEDVACFFGAARLLTA